MRALSKLPLLSPICAVLAALVLPLSAASASPRPGDWGGALGVATVAPLPGEIPGESWNEVCGSLFFKITAPTSKAPNGAYTATLSVFDGRTLRTFRGKGSLGEQGKISAVWKGAGKPAPECRVDLDFSPTPDQLLSGRATLVIPAETFVDTNGNGQRDPLESFTDADKNGSWDAGSSVDFAAFIMPFPYGKSSPLPANISGKLSVMCLAEGAELPLGIFAGAIDSSGKMSLGGTWQDGRRASLAARILRYDSVHLLLPATALGKDIFFGARATFAADSGGSDWTGRGWERKSGTVRPLRFEGFRSGNNAGLNWPLGKADLYLEHGSDVEYASGTATIVQRSNQLALEGVTSHPNIRSISMSFFPSEALVKGQMTYVVVNTGAEERRVTVPLSGALNPSTGVVRGRVGSIGWFSLEPLPLP